MSYTDFMYLKSPPCAYMSIFFNFLYDLLPELYLSHVHDTTTLCVHVHELQPLINYDLHVLHEIYWSCVPKITTLCIHDCTCASILYMTYFLANTLIPITFLYLSTLYQFESSQYEPYPYPLIY